MPERQAVEFKNFAGGDAGRERPAHGDLTQYRGSNTWLYPSGALGPRPAWAPYAVTGLPTGKTLRCFLGTVSQGGLWFTWAFSDGTVYSSTPAAPATAALRGTLAGDPQDSTSSGDLVYFVCATTGAGKVSSDGTFTAIASLPAGNLIAEYGQQIVVLQNPTGTPPKLWWSALNDGTSWPVANVLFIGSGVGGSGLYVQRDSLVIPKVSGDVWVLTGVLGVNESLRLVDTGVGHPAIGLARGAVAGSSVLYYTTGKDLSAFTGAQIKMVSRPDLVEVASYRTKPYYAPHGQIISLRDDNKILVLGAVDGTADATLKQPWASSFSPEAGWNRHTVPITPYKLSSALMLGLRGDDNARGLLAASTSTEGIAFVVTPSDATAMMNGTLRHFLLNTRLERPYLALTETLTWAVTQPSNFDADSALPVVASFQSAEWWAEDGNEVAVRGLLVDYSYDSDSRLASEFGATAHNRMAVSVEALQPADGTAVAQSTAIVFAPTAGTTIDGDTIKRGRELFQFGDQGSGGGFRFRLEDWRGICIHQVTAIVDLTPVRV